MIPFNQSSTSQPIPPSHTSSIAPDLTTQQPPPPHPPPLPPPTLSHPPPPPPPPPPPSQQQHPSCIHHLQQQQQQQQHPVPMHLSVNLPPHPEHLWNPDTNPPATASDNSSQHLQPQHHPVPSYDASPYSLAHTDKTNLYHHHPLAVIPPHVQQPQPSPSTHPNYIYPVHNHLVTPVAHVPIGAAHYAHLPSSIWTSPHGQYHPPPLPSTPRPPTNLSQLHPAQVHPNPQHYTLPLPDPSNPTTLSHSNLHHPVMHQSPHPQFTYSYSHIPPTPPQYMEDVHAHPPPQNMPVQYALSSSHLPTLVNQPLPLKNFDQINTHQQNPVVQTSAVPSKSNSSSVPSHLPSIPTSNHPKSSPHSQHLEPSSLGMENKDTHPPPSSSTPSSKTAEATERSLPENTSSPRKRKSHLSLQDQDLATNATSSSNHETPDKLSPPQKLKSAPVIKGQLLRKPRKPYTITKSREVWTKDEHSRFLTALQMFDRDWKKIEAYIGTKTVLQIRSHAQKHFGKVAKYNTGEYIPPPRPKKRAVLPYPRSRSTTPSKAAIVSIANGMCASASGNGSASDSGTGSDDDNPERSLQASLTVNEEDNDNLLERDPDRSDMEQPMSTAPKFTKYKKGGLSANESKESDAKSNGDISDVEMYQHDGRTNVTLVTQRSKVSVLTTKDPEKLCESLVDRSDSENGYEKKTDNRRKDVATDSSRNIQDHKLYNKNDAKVDSTPDVTVEVSRKREVISMAVGSAIDVYSRVQTEGDCSRDEKLIDAGLLEANYPLLVLSNCVDMMSREKGESPMNKQSQDVTSRQPRLKKPRLQKLSFSSKNKIAMLATCNNNDELQRRRLPSSPNRSNESLMEDSTEEKESRDFRCRQNTSNEDSSRGRSPPVVTDEDDEKVDGHNCPQQSSTGSGSFSDDAIAGFSNSDVGMGSSCGGSRRGSTDNSDSGDGDEDPKSSNEGSRVGALLNTPSRDSSPLDPNSSLSRENSPNNNELIDGVNGVNEIQRRNGPVAHVRNQNSCLRFNECAVGGRHERRPSWCDSEKEIREAIESEEHRRMININELDSDMKNRGKTCDEKDNSRINTRLGNNDDKSDGPRIFFHLENNAKDSGHLLTNKTVTPGVPVTKGIANLINVSDSQMNGNCMLHQEKNKSRMETNKDAFANKNRESTIETCSECDNRKRQSSLRDVDRRSPSR